MTDRYRVLVVEDDEIDRLAIERLITSQDLPYDYQMATSFSEARDLLSTQQFDVALMDYELGDGNSLDLFPYVNNMPIIQITGSADTKIAIAIMKAGAYDFLVKTHDGQHLTALPITVRNAVESWRAERELERYRNHLEEVIEERTVAWLEGELRLHTIVEAAPIIVFSLDTQARITFISGRTEAILGYPAKEMLGQEVSALFPMLSRDNKGIKRVISGEHITSDIELDGRWLSVSISPKRENGSITGVIGVAQDVTMRKQAELAMLNERNLLRTLIDNIPDYIFIKDREGRFIESNHSHAAGANLIREQIIGKTAFEVFDADLAKQFHDDDQQVLSTGTGITNQERITTAADGTKRWVLTTKVPLFDSKSQVTGLVGISRDVTELRKAEEAKLEAVRMRLDIEQERELVEMKQRFITTASHDFRTPLTIIKMAADTLMNYRDRLTPEKQHTKLEQIHSNVDRMVALLDDVLTLGKATADRISFSPSIVDVKPLCDRIWEDMVEIDGGRHMSSFQFNTTVSQVEADEQLLQHMLVNLISNAFKYTAEGGRVIVSVESDDQAMAFKITDTGRGIPGPEQKHLFEPFFRATNTKNIKGTGLGLAIVKAYVDLHNGTITAQSEEGTGTTFTVQIPLRQPRKSP
ncbi:MAG: PAS domain S-box protein [Anaerolineae bacterium]